MQNTERTTLTTAWDKTCRPKSEGGIGIKKTKDVNVAFSAKQGGKVLTQPDNK